jgi:hypothetical protein
VQDQALWRHGRWAVVAGGACVHVGLQARPRWCCKNDADAGGKLRNDYTEFGGAPVDGWAKIGKLSGRSTRSAVAIGRR